MVSSEDAERVEVNLKLYEMKLSWDGDGGILITTDSTRGSEVNLKSYEMKLS